MSTLSTFKRFFIVIALLFTFYLLTDSSTVRACSGGDNFFDVDDFPKAELLIKATVIDADDRGFNAILRVEEYYKGSGGRHLTVVRYDQSLATTALVRDYDTGCLYAGGGPLWQKGTQGYFGLTSNGNGTYTDDVSGATHFFPIDGKIYLESEPSPGRLALQEYPKGLSEKNLIQKMLEAGKRTAPVPPPSGNPVFYPLMRFVNITTEKGTRYQINPDRSVMKVEDDSLLAVSADGAHLVYRADSTTISLRPAWGRDVSGDPFQGRAINLPGQAAAFSNDNNIVAIWDAEKLTVYFLPNFENSDNRGSRRYLYANKIAEHAFAKGSAFPEIVWSANGTTVVWNELDAIWHWNLFDKAAPQKFAYPDPAAAVMNVSSHGRYILTGNPQKFWMIDTQTGLVSEDTLYSPNEQFVVKLDRAKKGIEVNPLGITQPCLPPIRDNCFKQWEGGEFNVKAVFPYQMELMGIVSCSRGESGLCIVTAISWHPAISDGYYGRKLYARIEDFRALDYDVRYRKPVIQVGDYGIYFEFYYSDALWEAASVGHLSRLDVLDLKDKIDSPIAAVEWGQQVFFDEYLLSSLTTAG